MKLKHIILLIALSLSYSGHILVQTVYVTNQQQFKEYADRTESACTPNLTIAVEGSIKNLNDVKLCDNLTIEGMPYTDAVLSAKGSFRPVTLLEVGRNDTIKNITLNLQSDEDDIALTNNSLLNGFGSLKVNHVVDENGLMKFSVSQQQQQPSTLFFKDNTINLGMQPVSSNFVAALEVDAYTKKNIDIKQLSMNKITTMGIAEPGILLVAAGGEIDIPNGESTNTITINSAKDSPPILNVAQASANNPYPSKIVIGGINGNHITTNDFEGAAIENRAIGFNTQERKVVAGGIIINGDMQNNVISNKGELYAPAIYNHAKNNAYIIYKGGFNGNTISSMTFPDYRDIENSQILNVAEHDSYISFTKLPVSNAFSEYACVNSGQPCVDKIENPSVTNQATDKSEIKFVENGLTPQQVAEEIENNNKFIPPKGYKKSKMPVSNYVDDTSSIQ